jgi:hypothetical protein
MTQTQLLLLPAFVHVALVVYLLVRMGSGRVEAVKRRVVKLSEVDTNKSAYPEPVRNFANNYHNQYELPVLYYAVLAFAMYTGLVDTVLISLSWGFVASRILHSYVQTGKNVIRTRFKVFTFGLGFLLLLWGWFGLRLFVIG